MSFFRRNLNLIPLEIHFDTKAECSEFYSWLEWQGYVTQRPALAGISYHEFDIAFAEEVKRWLIKHGIKQTN